MIYFLMSGSYDALTIVAILLAYVLVIIFSMSLHEFAHAYTAVKMGDLTPKAQGRLSVNPLRHIEPLGILCFLFIGFGWAKAVQINPLKFRNYKLGMSLVSIAGVITNFFLAFVFSAFLFFFGSALLVSTNLYLNFLYYLLYFGVIINLALTVFNLIPIYPLDGFNFIKSFMKYDNKFVQFMYRYGNIILLVFIITPIFDVIYNYVTSGILVGFFAFWGLFV